MIYGRIVLRREEAAMLKDGERFQFARARLVTRFSRPPTTGDLIWVQEPFVEIEGRRDPTRAGIHYGTMVGYRTPAHLKHADCKVHVCMAQEMSLALSRFTLEVRGRVAIKAATEFASVHRDTIVAIARLKNVSELTAGVSA